MRVFVYEFITGGGLLGTDGLLSSSLLPPSLLSEGKAMVTALVADLSCVEGYTVSAMRDHRLPDLKLTAQVHDVSNASASAATFRRLAAEADWTIVIAPEFDGHLHTRTVSVRDVGGRLLGPSPDLVALVANKQRTAEHLAATGVPVPASCSLGEEESLPRDFPYPAVLKPVDGAGSQDVLLIRSADEKITQSAQPRRLERFCPGTAASVAFLCGPKGNIALKPCYQHLSDDEKFRYLGGSLLEESTSAERAQALATRAINALHDPFGYLGVDLILGQHEDGSDDVVLEINPRLTTSYVGLRAAANENLAAAMLDAAMGRRVSLSFRDEPLQFDTTGVSVTGSQAELRNEG